MRLKLLLSSKLKIAVHLAIARIFRVSWTLQLRGPHRNAILALQSLAPNSERYSSLVLCSISPSMLSYSGDAPQASMSIVLLGK